MKTALALLTCVGLAAALLFHVRESFAVSAGADPEITVRNAYYYEFGNAEYEQKLQMVLSLGTAQPLAVDLADSYDRMIAHITRLLNSPAAVVLDLPGDNPYERPRIQIVQHELIAAHANSFTASVVLYRYGKHHAKEVHISATVDANTITYTSAKVVGTLSSDHIGFYPVLFSDPDPQNVSFTQVLY